MNEHKTINFELLLIHLHIRYENNANYYLSQNIEPAPSQCTSESIPLSMTPQFQIVIYMNPFQLSPSPGSFTLMISCDDFVF